MISKHTGRLQGLTGALALMLAFAAAAAGKIKIHVPELPSAEATAPYPAQTFTAADDDDATCCTWTSSGNLDGLILCIERTRQISSQVESPGSTSDSSMPH